jgi:Rieske Fe-S protein
LSDPTAPSSVSGSIKVADFPSLASVGGVATVSVSGSPVAVVRTGAATFIALSRICPHQGSTISVLSNEFQCPRHGATFNMSGGWIGGQPTGNMFSYPATYAAATDTLTIG